MTLDQGKDKGRGVVEADRFVGIEIAAIQRQRAAKRCRLAVQRPANSDAAQPDAPWINTPLLIDKQMPQD